MVILTPQERKALVFAGAVFFIGVCLQAVFKLYPPAYVRLSFLDRPPAPSKVSVNHANYQQLVTVPGIGPSVAARILYAREARGRFATLDELRSIKGFSRKNMGLAWPHLVLDMP